MQRMRLGSGGLTILLSRSRGELVPDELVTRIEPVAECEHDIAHTLGQKRFDHFIEQVELKMRRITDLGWLRYTHSDHCNRVSSVYQEGVCSVVA